MITSDLIAYIQAQIKKNISKDIIVSNLSSAGWKSEDIEEGFTNIYAISPLSSSVKEVEPSVEFKTKESVDPYRELPNSDISIDGVNENKTETSKAAEGPIVWSPKKIEQSSQSVFENKVFTPVENIKPTSDELVIKPAQIVQQKEIEAFLKEKSEKNKIAEDSKKIWASNTDSYLEATEEKKSIVPDVNVGTNFIQPTPELVSEIKPTEEIKLQAPGLESPKSDILAPTQSPVVPLELKSEATKIPELKNETIKQKEEPKIWVPMMIKPVVEIKTPEVVSTSPVVNTASKIEAPILTELNSNIKLPQNEANYLKEEIKDISKEGTILSEVSVDEPKKSFLDYKLGATNFNNTENDELSAKKPITQIFPSSPLEPSLANLSQVDSLSIPIKGSQFIPIKPEASSTSSSIYPEQNQNMDSGPKSAMLSSYKQALTSINPEPNNISVNKGRGLKWIFILIIILLIVSGTVFAFIKGYIKFPDSLIKKDPKIVLLNTTTNFASLKSYKIDTEISISSPSFANITSGLVNEQAVVSNDIDSVTINAKGLVSRNDSSSPNVDYTAIIKGSFIKSDIETEVKYDGNTSYLKIPDLTSILGENSPSPSVVSVPNGQFSLITPELPLSFQDNLQKVDAFQVLSKLMSSSFGTKVSPSFKEFLGNVTMVDKGTENIHGQDTYHYEIVVDGPTSKKFLVDMLNIFASTISADTKTNIEESLGSTTVDSLDVWVGKSDSNIHQYKLALSIPLSKVIGLDDKGIANNKVKLDWTTTYFDFDVPNTITMPLDSMKIEDYIKNIHDMRIKNTLSGFSPVAKNLFNAEGSFGKSQNLSGSCISPVSGSIFSPLGHTKGAVTSVGAIASSMNDLLSLSNGSSLCYSTPVAWAIATPLSSNPNLFACVDNAGTLTNLPSAPKGPVCK